MKQSKPEVIFVADQSGSMEGPRTKTLVAALRGFLKSLPVGIKFNICYFGDSHSFHQKTLEKALKSLDTLNGNYGGTETLSAVRASVSSRDNNQLLSIILATDGDIWQQQELFEYLNDSVATAEKTLRVFALGIGNSVSSALIEGVARAGNGFAQSVGEDEKLDGKVIRMLRGALTPDHGAFTMEIQYQKDDDDEFVMVERVSDSLRVLAFDEVDWPDAKLSEGPAASTETARGKKNVELPDSDGQVRYSHIPAVPTPKVMQTPQNIPPLYPYSRTNVYILVSPEAAQGTIKSIILKGNSPEEPFELEIPIEVLSERGETIHQLAAKEAVMELEEGRGWLVHAKDENGVLIKEKFSICFPSMVEREAVRLGIQYQIAGKFTSFVATETDPENPEITVQRGTGIFEEANTAAVVNASFQSNTGSLFGALASGAYTGAFSAPLSGRSSNLFNSAMTSQQSGRARTSTGGQAPRKQLASMAASPHAARITQVTSLAAEEAAEEAKETDEEVDEGAEAEEEMDEEMSAKVDTKVEETDPLQKIIALQTFEGYWNLNAPLLEVVGLPAQHKAPQGVDSKVWAAVLAITFLERKMAGEKEVWEMVVEKARGWLGNVEKGQKGMSEEMWTMAEQLIMVAN